VSFLYADGEIQWTTGDASGGSGGLGGISALAGFNTGTGDCTDFFYLKCTVRHILLWCQELAVSAIVMCTVVSPLQGSQCSD